MINENEMEENAKEEICGFYKMPLIGDEAPGFTADSTQGPINFPADYEGKWVILFSHPADFTPVCTSEIASFAAMTEEFKTLNTELLGVSVDSVSSHIAWLKAIQDNIVYNDYNGQPITFPIIADMKMSVAKKYGMIQPGASDTKAVRAVFFIDPKHKVRAIIYYPLTNGRNLAEIKRLLQALQTTDENSVSTPADWQPGSDVLLPAPATMKALSERQQKMKEGKELECPDWFFCKKKLV